MTNTNYAKYIPMYALIFTCFGPILIMITFTYLTHHTIQLTRALAEQGVNSQLIRIVSSDVI
ncbi:hypothetical protein I4U23_004790 [Adineta vaga]|nr:hypothetical protein I4U23_004790 [Adineta vaga]